MRVLVFGATGMLGHRVLQVLETRHEAWGTMRQPVTGPGDAAIGQRMIGAVDVTDVAAVGRALEIARPEAVVNCVGLVKQDPECAHPRRAIEVNALWPHRLRELAAGVRILHFSTDCVFSGARGRYKEEDAPDAWDVYGRSKMLGELTDSESLTIRSSIIGLERRGGRSLLEWFIAQRGGAVKGFRRALFSGLTTTEMARVALAALERSQWLSGLYHVASRPISKYDLLLLLNEAFNLGVSIVPDDDFVCDRSLDGSRFGALMPYEAPTWDVMVQELAAEWKKRGRGRLWT